MTELSINEKQRLLKEWKESGKSAALFCREKEIRPTTFYGWIKRERKKSNTGFVQIKKYVKPAIRSEDISIEKDNLKIKLPANLIGSHLEKIIKALS